MSFTDIAGPGSSHVARAVGKGIARDTSAAAFGAGPVCDRAAIMTMPCRCYGK